MQLKFTRTTDSKGLFGGKTVYCVDAILSVDEAEKALLDRFQYWGHTVWFLTECDDEAHRKPLFECRLQALLQGARLTYENFNDAIAAEVLVVRACTKALETVEALATFNGSDRVYEVTSTGHTFVTAD